MPTNMQSANETKTKIIQILKLKGPSLPVQVASQTGISPLFAGAFLSELAKENSIRISSMKVGSSPLYFLTDQKSALEKFYTYLPGKEKEAFLLLREKKILEDKKQQPAIRVALRALKDFAVPFYNDNEVWWRFHSTTEQQVREIFEKQKIKKPEIKKETREKATEPQLNTGLKPPTKQKVRIRKQSQNFLEEIKTFIQNKNIALISLEQIDKRKIIAKINIDSKPYLLAAYNKKRITEKELLRVYKLASEFRVPYYVVTRDNPTKKMQETMRAYKALLKIDKFE